MNEEKFATLCRKIEKCLNNAYEYQWNRDNLSEYHSALFSSYDKDEYMTVYHDGYHVDSKTEKILVENTPIIGEIEVDLENLRDEISECTEEQLERLYTAYCLHYSESNVLAYLTVIGFYAVIKNEDFNPDTFNCGACPF